MFRKELIGIALLVTTFCQMTVATPLACVEILSNGPEAVDILIGSNAKLRFHPNIPPRQLHPVLGFGSHIQTRWLGFRESERTIILTAFESKGCYGCFRALGEVDLGDFVFVEVETHRDENGKLVANVEMQSSSGEKSSQTNLPTNY